eukprot:7156979-Pyramimonas_sp.AAC.1
MAAPPAEEKTALCHRNAIDRGMQDRDRRAEESAGDVVETDRMRLLRLTESTGERMALANCCLAAP